MSTLMHMQRHVHDGPWWSELPKVVADVPAAERRAAVAARVIEFLSDGPADAEAVARRFLFDLPEADLLLRGLLDAGRVRLLADLTWGCVRDAVPVLRPVVGSFW